MSRTDRDEERDALQARLRAYTDGWVDGAAFVRRRSRDADYAAGYDDARAAFRDATKARRRALGLDGLALVRGGK